MKREGWTREEPDSPCLSVCVIHPSAGICIGCHRTAEEVRNWSKFAPEDRLRLLDELPSRKQLLRKRRGGRKSRLRK